MTSTVLQQQHLLRRACSAEDSRLAIPGWVTERDSAVPSRTTIDRIRAARRYSMLALSYDRSALGGHMSALPCRRLSGDTTDGRGNLMSVES